VAVRTDPAGGPRPWSQAWAHAAYAGGGFYADPHHPGPGAHFRTSVHVGPVFHQALATLLLEVDERLGRPPRLDLVDVGAGRGELAAGVLAALPDRVAAQVHALAIDVRPRPDELDGRVGWAQGTAPHAIPAGVRGLLLAHEWLDDVPLDVVEVDADGRPRLVLVDPHGQETLGPALDDDAGWAAHGLDAGTARAWLERWWPIGSPGERAEIGRSRDLHWEVAVRRLAAGTALAVDYGHTARSRPRGGSLTAYADGRPVRPVPDGSVNLTAHVAVDSLAAATGSSVAVLTQREALLALGVDARLPDTGLATSAPPAYAAALGAASDASELLDPAGLGAFSWVRVDVG
jgi:SAM-dependent MidA family methyltransferase